MTGFREYNPQSEPASFRAGGKHAYLDLVTGLEVPEAQTRVAALVTKQVDFLDIIPPTSSGRSMPSRASRPLSAGRVRSTS